MIHLEYNPESNEYHFDFEIDSDAYLTPEYKELQKSAYMRLSAYQKELADHLPGGGADSPLNVLQALGDVKRYEVDELAQLLASNTIRTQLGMTLNDHRFPDEAGEYQIMNSIGRALGLREISPSTRFYELEDNLRRVLWTGSMDALRASAILLAVIEKLTQGKVNRLELIEFLVQ